MKSNYFKQIALAIVFTGAIAIVKAQDQKTAFSGDRNDNYDVSDSKAGRSTEHVQTNWKGKFYRMELVNNKMTELYVDDEKIPAAKWGEYSAAITAIREQIRKDRIQAAKDQVQARKDQEQARLDQKQAEKDQEQARIDQQQALKDEAQAKLDQQQASKDQEAARADQEQARKEQVQAKLDQEQALKDQAQAKLDQQQAARDQLQAKKDQEQALEDQKLMKNMIEDLVKDGIAANEKSLYSVTMNVDGMTVNDKKQPEEVFKRYKAKYPKFTSGEFSYDSNRSSIQNFHLSKTKQ